MRKVNGADNGSKNNNQGRSKMDLIKKDNGDFSSGFLEGLGKSLGAAVGSAIIALALKLLQKKFIDNQNDG